MNLAIMIVIGLLVAGGIGFASHMASKKRKAGFEEVAESMGLTFYPDGNPDLLQHLSSFKLFSQGRSRKMRNLIQGDSGEVTLAIFDYRYTTGSGKNSHTHRQTVVSLHSDELTCPDFTMRPEGFLDRIGGALGFQDIDFETHPLFSKSFVLQGSDEAAVRKYFGPALLEFFETRPGISVEAQFGTLFFYRGGKVIKPAQTKDQLAQAYEIYGMMVEPGEAEKG